MLSSVTRRLWATRNNQYHTDDFTFDFLTHCTIVCSELIYKIYLRGEQKRGLDFQLRELAGRLFVPPNHIVGKFDTELKIPSQELDVVCFLDGSEEKKKTVVTGPQDSAKVINGSSGIVHRSRCFLIITIFFVTVLLFP